ncbi:MAG: OmpH family outer membrane protein [Bacteroidales bacterium]|nr:OmpH family outer membrane protein [Bacteroidales bacterium]MBN2817624.1 OmpH family outer membrane protein [Bacteroidales bacterium]
MKKTQLVINAILIAGLVAVVAFQFLKKDKIAYVEVGKLMQEYKGMKAARAEFEKKTAQWQANVDTLIAEFQDELKAYEKERSRMSSKEKELKEELLRNKQMQIGQYQEAIKQKSVDEEQILTQTAINSINDYIEEFGKEHSYKFIIGATGQGNLLYALDRYNITQEILAGLNMDYELDNN